METVFIIISISLIGLGYYVRRFKAVHIIAGYDPKQTKDKAGLANWVGNNLMLMGTLSLFSAIITMFSERLSFLFLVISFLVIVILLSIRTALGCKKY